MKFEMAKRTELGRYTFDSHHIAINRDFCPKIPGNLYCRFVVSA